MCLQDQPSEMQAVKSNGVVGVVELAWAVEVAICGHLLNAVLFIEYLPDKLEIQEFPQDSVLHNR